MRIVYLVLVLLVFCVPATAQGHIEVLREVVAGDIEARRVNADAILNLVYDDGEADNGFRAATFPNRIELAMRFDAVAPGTVDQVQVCLQRINSFDLSSGTFGIGIYSATATGPGSPLHLFEASVTGLPLTGMDGSMRTFALPPPARSVPASFFVVIELDRIHTDFWLCADHDGIAGERPVFGAINGGSWEPLRSAAPSVKALMIRTRVETADAPPPPPPPSGSCVEDATTACLLGGRFEATVRFRNGFDNLPADTTADRKAVTGFSNAAFETEFFYFNNLDNIEVMLKMLDQGNANAAGEPTIAVLTGAATPLRTEVTITDTQTGVTKTYISDFGSQAGVTDFTAFVK